jgi:hypothetical protein
MEEWVWKGRNADIYREFSGYDQNLKNWSIKITPSVLQRNSKLLYYYVKMFNIQQMTPALLQIK